jgi:site-specific DNA-methyltransferase (adenine-specific)
MSTMARGSVAEKTKKVLGKVAQKPYFKADNFVLYLGDSIEFLKSLPENSVDMIFADPPYNLSNDGFTVHAGKRVSVNKGNWDVSKGVDEDFEFHSRWIKQCYRVLKPEGTIWISGTYHSIYQCGFALQLLGYKILNDITWFKPNASPNLSGRYFTASHETLLWARKDPKGKHTFNYQDMKNGSWHAGDFIKKEGKQMRSVWAIGTPKREEKIYGKHPTQKPMALLDRIVLASTNKGDVIIDPFTGSSTTGLAAVKSSRKFIGIDLQKDYLDLSVKRYKDLAKQGKLL